VEHLLCGEECLQVGDQKQYPRVIQGGQLVMQFRVQDFVGASSFLQLLASFG